MRKFIITTAFCLIGAGVNAEPYNFVSAEYAPISNHLTDEDAPAGGYNENNNIVILKFGREYQGGANWDYNFTAGYTLFKNSYDETSHGPGVGAEALYKFTPKFKAYGGADVGLVTGYDGNVDDDYLLFNKLVPFLALNTGLEYDLGAGLPSIRGGIKYVPASIVDSDDVVAYSVGARISFP